MFTGIVEAVGRVTGVSRRGGAVRLEVDLGPIAEGVAIGDSISNSGVCLTVVAIRGSVMAFDAVEETLAHSALADLRVGAAVNLERALAAGDRFGGHFVQGHVDGTAELAKIEPVGAETRLHFRAGPELCGAMIQKGSVAIDGISLTLAELTESAFACAIIPHTLEVTTLGKKKVGDRVNIETDMIGKWVIKQLSALREGGGLSEDFLRKHGFH